MSQKVEMNGGSNYSNQEHSLEEIMDYDVSNQLIMQLPECYKTIP